MSTLLSADSFDWADTAHTIDRVDSATSLGSTDGAGTLDPLAWTARSGTWGISLHQAYTAVTATTAIATVNLGTGDVDLTLVTSVRSSANGTGIVFRWSSSTDYWYVRNNSSGNTQLFLHTSGGDTQFGGNQSGAADGDTLRVIASGTHIDVYRNGVLKISITNTANMTATNHGLENSTGASNRLDSWSASKAPAYYGDFTDATGVTESFARSAPKSRAFSDTIGVSDTLARRLVLHQALTDIVGLTDLLHYILRVTLTDTIGVSGSLSATGNLIQYDSWRPIPKPDNTLVLVCRTPQGDHDTTLTGLSLWTVHPDGSGERWAVHPVSENGYGWVSFDHPEWSPDGENIVVHVETSTQHKIMLLGATGFGMGS